MKKDQPDKQDYQSDILDLQRKILKGVLLKDIDFADNLKGQDRINFLKFCSETANSLWFDQIFVALCFPQLLAAANAQNYDEVSFHRATTNGINFVKEFFLKQSRQFEIEFAGNPEDFDSTKAFEPVRNN